MDVQVQTPGGLRRSLTVKVPAERVAKAVDERLKKVATRAKLPGFRPGKAPFKVIVQQFGDSARMEAVSDLINQTYPEAVRKAAVQPAGNPKIDVTAEKPGEPLEYVAHIEVYPEIKFKDLSGSAIEKPVTEVSTADVDKLINNLVKAKRTFEATTRKAVDGDSIVMDFVGSIDGVKFAGGESKDAEMVIGEGRFLPDLEKGIVGHAAGEEFTVAVNFPADYRNEELKGKTAQFAVTLKSVKEAKLPAIDAEFLKSHSVDEAKGEAGLREKCQQALEKERSKGIQNRIKGQVLDALLAANPMEIPQALIEQEIPRLREEAANRMGLNRQGGQQWTDEKLAGIFPAEMFTAQAVRRVSLGLLMNEAIKAKDIKLDAKRVETTLEGLAADYENPEQVRQFYRGRPDLMQGLRAMALEDQAVEALLANAKVSDKSMSLDELLTPPKAAQA